MSEQKYYVFQKSVDGKKIVSQLVRCKFMGENAKFVPLSNSKSGRYENSFSELTKIELAKIGNGALYTQTLYKDCIPPDHVYYCSGEEIVSEWINPLIELVPVEEEDVSN